MLVLYNTFFFANLQFSFSLFKENGLLIHGVCVLNLCDISFPLSRQSQRHVQDLYEDLRDGHNLISLLEVLSGETLVSFAMMSDV